MKAQSLTNRERRTVAYFVGCDIQELMELQIYIDNQSELLNRKHEKKLLLVVGLSGTLTGRSIMGLVNTVVTASILEASRCCGRELF